MDVVTLYTNVSFVITTIVCQVRRDHKSNGAQRRHHYHGHSSKITSNAPEFHFSLLSSQGLFFYNVYKLVNLTVDGLSACYHCYTATVFMLNICIIHHIS